MTEDTRSPFFKKYGDVIFYLVMGAVFLAYPLEAYPRESALVRNGVHAKATVQSVSWGRARRDFPWDNQMAEIVYFDEAGLRHFRSRRLSDELERRVQPGQEVDIVYERGRPSNVQIAREARRKHYGWYALSFFAGVALMGWGIFRFVALRRES